MATIADKTQEDIALSYVMDRGWKVFPCHYPIFIEGQPVRCSCGKADCSNIGKHPATVHGLKDATDDPEQVKQWWSKNPYWNIAIATGEASGFVVIDLDTHDADGLATWAKVEAKHGEVHTLQARTGGGGIHMLFAHAGATLKNKTGILPGVDIRGDGGYIIAPGSVHPSGNDYGWMNEDQPIEAMPVFVLDWLHGGIDPLTGKEAAAGKGAEAVVIEPPAKPQPATNGTATKEQREAYGKKVFDMELAKLKAAKNGTRNNTLFEVACNLYELAKAGALEAAKVTGALTEAAGEVGLEDDEVAKSLDSAWKKTTARDLSHLKAKPAKAAATAEGNDDEAAGGKKDMKPTDDELAGRWINAHPETAHGMGAWRRYSNGWWDRADAGDVNRELLAVIEAAKPEGIRPTAGRVESVRTLAAIKVGKGADKWDADADVIVCANGTLHVPSLTLREWSPADMMTSAVAYDYDPAATCPVFLKALNDSVPEAHDLLQEFAGYALTTDTRHEIALWLYGAGGSGKSTIIEGFMAMLGAGKFINLGLSDVENSRFALSRLPGKTLAISTEQPSGLIRATDVLNRIISGEPVTVEQKFQDAYEVRPRAKLLWAMNELPRVPDANNGLFRRVKVIHFPPRDEANRDPSVKEAIKGEGAGILNWALEGLHRLRRRGKFLIPAKVTEATENFKTQNDVPALFVAERCHVGAQYEARSGALYKEYKEWCLENGHKPQSSTTIAEDWKRMGFGKRWLSGVPIITGVGLRFNIP